MENDRIHSNISDVVKTPLFTSIQESKLEWILMTNNMEDSGNDEV